MTCLLSAVGGAEKIEYKVLYVENGKEKNSFVMALAQVAGFVF